MKKLSLVIILLTISALLTAACSPAPVQESVVSAAPQPELLIAQGRLLPVNAMDQSFSVPGQVAEVLVMDSEEVTAGQVLARLHSSPEAQTALARAEQEVLAAQQALDALSKAAEANLVQARLAVIAAQAELEIAQERYEEDETDENQAMLDKAAVDLAMAEDNLKTLQDGKGVDPDLRAAAEARLAAANAALTSARAVLDSLELKSTLAGSIVDLALQPGQRAAAGAPVMTVADFSTWLLKTDNLTEQEVVDVRIGQKVVVVLDALPDQPLNGEVTHINARFEEKRGDITYTVTVALSQSHPLMRWGMTAAVQFLP